MAREYKDSGIEWIGQIPKEWEVNKIGNLYQVRNEKVSDKDYPPLSVTMNGIVPQLETAAKTNNGDDRKLVCKGDFAINSRSDRRGSCGVSKYDGSVSLINTILKPRGTMNPQYYNWLFHTELFADEFYRWGHGIVDDLWTTRWQEMKNISIVSPSLSEQQKIADYLDKVCGEIDEMVALQETMIEELKAYKQSVITEAVTKGLNPNVPMRNSGIDWIGEIPEHWEAKKLKYIVDYIESGTSVNAGNVPAQANEYGVLKTSAVSKYVFDATENKTVVSEEMDKVSCPVRKNTIIVSRMNTPELVGACGYVEKNYDNIFLPDRLWQVHFVDTVYVKFIWYALRGSNIRNYYSSLSVGSSSSMQNISQSQFSNGSIPIPSDVEEQCAIASYLDTKCSEIDSLIDLKQAKIEELKEYKKSVIYEYVTGKKEVV
jgi:type I restriction enzyme S subunit